MKKIIFAFLAFTNVLLVSCSSDEMRKPTTPRSPTIAFVANPLNELNYQNYVQGHFKIGKPYKQKGTVFTPKVDMDYEQVGLASWYGPNFHGKKTANGTKYNQHDYTAAHPTLPLPSVVRVTNLNNNKVIHVVVNDRGPFHKKGKRIIDLSKKGASDLGMLQKGVAKVKVEYLHDETKKLIALFPVKQQQVAVNSFKEALTKQLVEDGTLPSRSKL